MEAKFRVEDKVLDKSGKQWVIRHYRECEDGFYYGLYGKEDEVKESDLCLALPLGEYISDGVNGMSGISDPTGISGIFIKTTGNSILDEAKENFLSKANSMNWKLNYNSISKLVGKDGNEEEFFYFSKK